MKTDLFGAKSMEIRDAMENITLHSRCANSTRDGVDTRSKDLTVACDVTQELACDTCGAMDELKMWIGVDGKTYHSCKPCWFDIQDSYDEIRYNRCATCNSYPSDGTVLEVCEGCYLLDAVTETRDSCEECGLVTEVLDDYEMEDGELHRLCNNCIPSQSCECCTLCAATELFLHLDGRSFRLCSSCFLDADHEEEYGISFGSGPNR